MPDDTRNREATDGPTAGDPERRETVDSGSVKTAESGTPAEPASCGALDTELPEAEVDAGLAIADGREHALHPASITAARIAGFVTLACIATPLLIGATAIGLFADFPGAVKVAIFTGWALGTVVATVACQVWPRVRHEHMGYRVDETGFTIRRGVLWWSVTSIPSARIQHIDVSQGPLERRFDIASLTVHTAGTQDASVALGGLPHRVALEIRDFLVDGGDRDGV